MNEYKIFTQISFDWMIATYFFLGGISAGSFFFSVAANYWKKEFKPLAKTAAILSPIALAFGMLFLLADLGRPLRAWRIFLHFNPTSAISWGVWFLNIFFVLNLAYAWLLFRGDNEKGKLFAYAGLPFGLLVATYTGVLLTQAPGRALWHSALLPILFLIGGVISGIALVMLISAGKVENSISTKLGKFLGLLVLLELVLVFMEVVVLFNGAAEAVAVARTLLNGQYSFLFWIVEILIGAVIPMSIFFRGSISPRTQAVAAMLVLIGVYTMRYIIVVGGQVTG